MGWLEPVAVGVDELLPVVSDFAAGGGASPGVGEGVFGDAPEAVARLDGDLGGSVGWVGVGREDEFPAWGEAVGGLGDAVTVGHDSSDVEVADLLPAAAVAEGGFGDAPEGVEASHPVGGMVDVDGRGHADGSGGFDGGRRLVGDVGGGVGRCHCRGGEGGGGGGEGPEGAEGGDGEGDGGDELGDGGLQAGEDGEPAGGPAADGGDGLDGDGGDELGPGDPDDDRQGVDQQLGVDAAAEGELDLVEGGEAGGEGPSDEDDEAGGDADDEQDDAGEGGEAAGEVVEVAHQGSWVTAVAVSVAVTVIGPVGRRTVGSSRVDLQACKLEYSIVSPK